MPRRLSVTPLQQPTAYSCVHTCLAMIVDVPVEDLILRFGDHDNGFEEKATVLVENGLFPVNTTHDRHPFWTDGVYLVGTASLNIPGRLHCVVVEVVDCEYKVYDPNKGKKGKEYYVDEDVVSGRLARADVYYCDPWVLRKSHLAERFLNKK